LELLKMLIKIRGLFMEKPVNIIDIGGYSSQTSHYCLVLWSKKPFHINNILVSDTYEDMIVGFRHINDNTIKFCNKRLRQHLKEINNMDVRVLQWESRYYGYYACIFVCDNKEKKYRIEKIAEYVAIAYSYDSTYHG
jgi:hypothetical protein